MPIFRKKKDNVTAGTIAIGCGGGGCNIANRLGMISGTEILTVNTDRKGLVRSRSDMRILLGNGSIEEGCGGDVELGRSLTRDASVMIGDSMKGHLNAVILVGLGGGTGTGAAEVIAEQAKKNGSRVIVIATMPMSFESERRRIAADSLKKIMRSCDILVMIDSDRLAEIDPMIGAREAFSVLDQMVCESFSGLMGMLEGSDGASAYQLMKGRMFTVSFADGMNVEKVANALANGLMASASVISRPLIFVRGNIPQNGSEGTISKTISKRMGEEPAFIQGPEGRGMDLVLFAPIG